MHRSTNVHVLYGGGVATLSQNLFNCANRENQETRPESPRQNERERERENETGKTKRKAVLHKRTDGGRSLTERRALNLCVQEVCKTISFLVLLIIDAMPPIIPIWTRLWRTFGSRITFSLAVLARERRVGAAVGVACRVCHARDMLNH